MTEDGRRRTRVLRRRVPSFVLRLPWSPHDSHPPFPAAPVPHRDRPREADLAADAADGRLAAGERRGAYLAHGGDGGSAGGVRGGAGPGSAPRPKDDPDPRRG